ncbi:MAG: site-specific integrase [Chloroflexota bacterium]|nr:site-specific integrase [Chloroflexota bacterium]
MRGHITKRGTSWSAIVDLPPDPATGKRRQKRVTARTKREVESQVAELIQKAETGFTDAGKLTVRDFFDRWLEAVAPTLRPSTARRYRDVARLHIVGVIGNLRLVKLSSADVQRLYANRLGSGLSPTSVNHIHAILHRALDQAVRWGLLLRNVTDTIDPPRRSSPEMKAWDARQAATVLATAAGDDLEALWRLGLLTGMRRGEILGLRWADVDIDAGALSVRRTLSRGTSSRLEMGEPKTAAGRRRVALPVSVVESLRRHRVRQLEHRLAAGPAFEDQDLVFPNGTGGPLHPNSLALRFRRLTERAGAPAIRFHDLRHTCATLLLAEGVHPKVVQERLGHSNIAETLDRYSHVTADMQRGAADLLDAALDAASRSV